MNTILLKSKNNTVQYGKWQNWFAWYPVRVTVLYPFGHRTDSKFAWFTSVVKRRVIDGSTVSWQYVSPDDLSDYLTLEYGEMQRQAKQDRTDLF
jgi:hypothetical protein